MPALLGEGEVDPGLAIGLGQPNVAWTIDQRDRIYNVLLAGGQGSGKSSMLIRLGLNDMYAANTATVILDMKGSLSERLLRLSPTDTPKRWWDPEQAGWAEGTKRVWYLDLARPGFGLTPLQVEPGWDPSTLADEFSRIADAVCRALLDLYPGQIMGSSEDLIERAVVGAMAIAWFEHHERCQRDGVDATTRGFAGSFEVLAEMFAPSDRFDEEEAQNTAAGGCAQTAGTRPPGARVSGCRTSTGWRTRCCMRFRARRATTSATSRSGWRRRRTRSVRWSVPRRRCGASSATPSGCRCGR